MGRPVVFIEFHDEGPDDLGRRHYSLHWTDPAGIFREDLSKDGKPCGFRRSQHFFSRPPASCWGGWRVEERKPTA